MAKLTQLTVTGLAVMAIVKTLSTGASAGPCEPGFGSSGPGSTLTCIGLYTLEANTTGQSNTAIGFAAMIKNKEGGGNTGSGAFALFNNVSGSQNTATGISALSRNQTGSFNTASGSAALWGNTDGSNNTASGYQAGGKQTGSNNTSLGAEAGWRGDFSDSIRLTGSNNIAVGYQSGSQWTSGSNNIAIGNVGNAADLNTIRIGTPGVQSRTFIAGVRNVKVLKGQAVMVDINGQIGTTKSSIRYKEDVHSMGDASSPLMNLRPVTFRYKEAAPDGSKPIQYGLIAEEVEKVMPDLVIYNDQGTPESVAYETLPSLLLNEYQKQGRELAAAKAKLETMETELAALKLAVSRLAAAPSTVKLAATAP